MPIVATRVKEMARDLGIPAEVKSLYGMATRYLMQGMGPYSGSA